MPPRLSLSLLVSDPDRARAFWERLGLATSDTIPGIGSAQGGPVLWLARASTEAPQAGGRTGVLLAIDVGDRDEVDGTIAAAVAAGGVDAGTVEDFGGRYVRSFADPDGSVWLVVHDAGAGLLDADEAHIHAETTETEQDA